ncbi:MAG: sigma-54 dependent transcriptional regulator, partial [Xanthobacteraceae bacterium]
MPRILIIDDDDALRAALATSLSDLGHETAQAADGPLGLAWLRANRADAVLLDLRMPRMDGLEVLRRILEPAEAPPVAVLTAVSTAENTIEAMRIGAADHLTKPIGRADLAALLARMLPSADARPLAEPTTPPVDGLIGTSTAMREVHKAIGMLADSEATVLILGETGTGKEVVARAMHRHGRRAAKPFVPVNCAAIPAELLESQLFGHVRGAFTGAVADRAGFFREADGGVLFLDEIGDMDLTLQAKLLRVLQERVVTPVGGRSRPVDVRVIAATHRDLREAVRAGTFREDLYYRLGVVPLPLPPLRERL